MKNNYFDLSLAEQRLVMEQTAIRLSLPVQAVEKDLWVTAMLQIMFGLPCAGNLVFKGGTSLSKVWELINRFSEDIDLAIDRSQFNLEGDLTKKGVKKLRKASSVFVREELCHQLQEAVNNTPLAPHLRPTHDDATGCCGASHQRRCPMGDHQPSPFHIDQYAGCGLHA